MAFEEYDFSNAPVPVVRTGSHNQVTRQNCWEGAQLGEGRQQRSRRECEEENQIYFISLFEIELLFFYMEKVFFFESQKLWERAEKICQTSSDGRKKLKLTILVNVSALK